MKLNNKIIIYSFIVFTACTLDSLFDSDDIVQYFEYPDHNVLNIGSQLTDFYITNDSNTLIAADKGNNRVIFIDVSSDVMYIKKTIWVGSEPTSLDMSSDGRYLFVGLRGGSSVSVINIENLTMEGQLNLQQDSVFDIEYLSSKCQLIVSYKSTETSDNNTYLHAWWADPDGIWYGSNTSCSYADDSSVLTVSDFHTNTSPNDHTSNNYNGVLGPSVALTGGSGTGAVANVVVHEGQYIESVEIINGGSNYVKGEILTIPGSVIGGSDGQCIITGTFNSPKINISESNIIEVEPPQIYRLGVSGFIGEIKYFEGAAGASLLQIGGLLSISNDGSHLYILDKPHTPISLHRYDIEEYGFINHQLSSEVAAGLEVLHDLAFVDDFGVAIAFDGTDPVDGLKIDHVSVYDNANLHHISNLDVGSVPVAVAYDSVGKHLYISPTDVDDNGMFIVEFSIDTQLQTNYYQVAGLLGSHTLIVDPKGEYIYAAVDDLSDQDTHEPYNGSSFNIQKIKIIPEGTYPINDF